MKTLAIIAAALLTSAAAHAEHTSAEQCMKAKENTGMHYYCKGIAEGAVNEAMIQWLTCPTNHTYDQFGAFAIHWLRDHPERWNQDWSLAVVAAAITLAPCKQSKQPPGLQPAPGAY